MIRCAGSLLPKFMKGKLFIYIGFSLIVIMIMGGGLFYYVYTQTSQLSEIPSSREAKINENGASFRYPATLFHQRRGPVASSSHYAAHSITNSKDWYLNRSEIQILIPLANAQGETAPLSESLKDYPKELSERMPKIEPIMLNGHSGDKLVKDSSINGEGSLLNGQKQNITTSIQFDSKYPGSYIVLTYIRYDDDASLDKAWQMVLDSLNF